MDWEFVLPSDFDSPLFFVCHSLLKLSLLLMSGQDQFFGQKMTTYVNSDMDWLLLEVREVFHFTIRYFFERFLVFE